MEFLLDTINLADIKKYEEAIPLAGVTSNPSIVKNEGKIDFFDHMKKIRSIIGTEKSLHIQVVATDYLGMIKDAERIIEEIDSEVYIKVPMSEEGLKVIKELKKRGMNVTATAIYSKFQGYLAIAAGADYLAPYYNRMENLNIDSKKAIQEMAKEITRTNSHSKILAASFKNVSQVTGALEAGSHAATMGCDILKQAFAMPSIGKAVVDFTTDWESIYEEGIAIHNL